MPITTSSSTALKSSRPHRAQDDSVQGPGEVIVEVEEMTEKSVKLTFTTASGQGAHIQVKGGPDFRVRQGDTLIVSAI